MNLFNRFARFAIKYKDDDICKVYNYFLTTIKNDKERQFLVNHAMLVMKAGDTARNALPSIQKMF